jgi:hypothetical protein
MEKKINGLQKELKDLKEREKKRYLSKVEQTKMRSTNDGPIHLKSNI